MFEINNSYPVELMPRITAKELGERFEEVADIIDKENIGYVITDETGKEKFIICPYAWNNPINDDNFGCIINCALRYAIGRHTYMPAIVAEFLMAYINYFDYKTLYVAIKDIDMELKNNNVDDPEMWKNVQEKLTKRYWEIKEKRSNNDVKCSEN